MRVAIAHDWLDAPGGAEVVLRDLLTTFPEADVWTLWDTWTESHSLGAKVFTSPLQKFGLAERKAATLPLMPLIWRSLPSQGYDVVISDSSCSAHTVRFKKDQRAEYFHYIHTPARYLWSPELDQRGNSPALAPARMLLRRLDKRLASKHQHIAANSREVQRRIRKYWKKDAVVIHPGVDVEFFSPTAAPAIQHLPFDEYELGVSRWVPYKRLDLVIESADVMGVPAVIVGSGPEEARLRRIADKVKVPVHFEKAPSRERVRELMLGAIALCYPAHEDFGIVPVEAQAAGLPVVALDTGGTAETVRHGGTGYLCSTASPQEFATGLQQCRSISRDECISNAANFSGEKFRRNVRDWIISALSGEVSVEEL